MPQAIERISDLQRGDIIRHKGEGDSLLVAAIYPKRATAIRTVDVTNPAEWELVVRNGGPSVIRDRLPTWTLTGAMLLAAWATAW